MINSFEHANIIIISISNFWTHFYIKDFIQKFVFCIP